MGPSFKYLQRPKRKAKQRISKKSFGTYVTPQNSPVQPERFIGYHTGVDVEYDDKPDEKIPVYAIADGRVIHSAWVGGYGGVVIIRHPEYTALYGHLDPDSLIKKDTELVLGQEIGFLGQGYTNQTDNERKHLHLSIYTANVLNLKGYVQTKEELNKWIDPLKLK